MRSTQTQSRCVCSVLRDACLRRPHTDRRLRRRVGHSSGDRVRPIVRPQLTFQHPWSAQGDARGAPAVVRQSGGQGSTRGISHQGSHPYAPRGRLQGRRQRCLTVSYKYFFAPDVVINLI
jgi:hypothetical protein